MIMLLARETAPDHNPLSFTFSALLHGLGIGLLFAGLLENPEIIQPAPPARDSVRLIEMRQQKPKPPLDLAKKYAAPVPSTPMHDQTGANQQAAAMKPRFERSRSLHTILQPDVHKTLDAPEKVMLPTILAWSAHDDHAKEIVLHPPQLNLTSNALPSMARPNEEKMLADIAVTSSAIATSSFPVLPSSTSPMVVRAPQPTDRVPETSTETTKPPTEATVMSVSDLQMANGTVVLPQANAVASSDSKNQSSLAMGKQDAAQALHANGVASTTSSSESIAQGTSTSRLSAPKNGSFGLVVVGASSEEQYPEAAGMWTGRMVYTVYLHVGSAKNWILEYSQPRAAEVGATGNTPTLQSPWPTNMVIPNLPANSVSAEAMLVHGTLNKLGRFEDLAMIFPGQFPMAGFVLDALEQWEFRPASANGAATNIEVLLIIPE